MTDQQRRASASRPAQDGWRTAGLSLAVLFAFSVLAGRLIHLQWYGRGQFADRVRRQQSFTETIPARPGEIVDRHGHVLAMTVSCDSLFIDPLRIEDPEQFCARLSQAVDINAGELAAQIRRRRKQRFLWVRRRLSADEAKRIRELKLPGNTWGLREEFLRRYPQQELAAHVLGTRDIDGNGHGGIEQALDSLLQGKPGSRVLIRDARGAVIGIEEQQTQPAIDGPTVELTLDSVVQLRTEQALGSIMEQWRPKGACAMVLDPHNGELLAMASRPGFNPNAPDPQSPFAWTNLNISAVYEPGSTFKPLVVARAVDSRTIAWDAEINCEWGQYKMGPRILHDHHRYGRLDVTDIIARSSNIGMAKIGERMQNPGLYQTVVDFGFGSRTGIDLPGELNGLIRPLKLWDDYSTGSIPMGQELAVTPLQLLVAYAALANGGRLIVPHIVKGRTGDASLQEDSDTNAEESLIVSRPVSASVANWLTRGPLTAVVDRGTGRRAAIEGVAVFGKTGTAQKPDPESGGYSNSRHVCSFVCGAPAESPRVLVLVLVDEPTIGGPDYGGTVAAPAAAKILRHALHAIPNHQVARKPGRTGL